MRVCDVSAHHCKDGHMQLSAWLSVTFQGYQLIISLTEKQKLVCLLAMITVFFFFLLFWCLFWFFKFWGERKKTDCSYFEGFWKWLWKVGLCGVKSEKEFGGRGERKSERRGNTIKYQPYFLNSGAHETSLTDKMDWM